MKKKLTREEMKEDIERAFAVAIKDLPADEAKAVAWEIIKRLAKGAR